MRGLARGLGQDEQSETYRVKLNYNYIADIESTSSQVIHHNSNSDKLYNFYRPNMSGSRWVFKYFMFLKSAPNQYIEC